MSNSEWELLIKLFRNGNLDPSELQQLPGGAIDIDFTKHLIRGCLYDGYRGWFPGKKEDYEWALNGPEYIPEVENWTREYLFIERVTNDEFRLYQPSEVRMAAIRHAITNFKKIDAVIDEYLKVWMSMNGWKLIAIPSQEK